MQFIICPKHNKVQKAPHKVTTNCYICMNRYCQQSFVPLCATCKPQHCDHSNKILTLEDISFLIQRLLKSPFKQLSKYIDEAVSAMKKLKLIQQNKRKIEILQKEIYKQVINLVEGTEVLVHQYAKCKNKVTQLGDLLVNIQMPQAFKQLCENSRELLSNLQYNYQKDKFQYGNSSIRERYELRRKSYQRTRRKLQQVKDYSMKIIQVILANDQSQQEQEDIVYKKKMYEILKRQLEEQQLDKDNLLNNLNMYNTGNNKQILAPIQQSTHHKDNQNHTAIQQQTNQKGNQKEYSNKQNEKQSQIRQHNNMSLNIPDCSTTNYSIISQDIKSKCTAVTSNFILSTTQSSAILSIQKSSQTNSQWILLIQQSAKQYQLKLKKLQQTNAKSINELQNKISMLVRQKDTIKKQFSLAEQKHKSKNQKILQIEKKLRQNKEKRINKQKQRQNKLQKLIQIAHWKHIIEGDTIGQ